MVVVYSVGHSNHESSGFVALLRAAGVVRLVDVRRIPASGRFPWFTRRTLDAGLAAAGIEYHWLGEGLGGRREPMGSAEASPNGALREPAFRAYADAFVTPGFLRDLEALEALARAGTTALMCAERDWRQCHRQLLCDVLVVRGFRVEHLREAGKREPHVLNEWARVEGGRVTYPGLL